MKYLKELNDEKSQSLGKFLSMSINVYLYQIDEDEPKTKKFSPEAENPQETKTLPQKARNHFCNECDASFTCPVDLKRHIDSVHLGKKPFKCNIVDTASLTVCDYACARKWDLKRHRMEFHTDRVTGPIARRAT